MVAEKKTAWPLRSAAALLATLLPGQLLCVRQASAADIFVTNTNDSGGGSLRSAITSASSGDTIRFSVSGTVTLASELPILNKNVTIDGNGNNPTISGSNTFRPFFVGDAGTTGSTYTVTIANLTITNARANGGTGASTGAGAGLGGAVFVSSNGALTLSNVAVSNTQANGGSVISNIATTFAGGAGMGGNAGLITTPGGGGGLFVGSNADGSGNGAGPNGGAVSLVLNGPNTGGAGGFASGGGGASANTGGSTGGAGGFGGGGGGANNGAPSTGGVGGFGGGGGSAGPIGSTGGNGGFGGGGGFGYLGVEGKGGFGAGNGGTTADSGGGGLGAGGAIFVQNGGTLVFQDSSSQTSGSVTAGAGNDTGTNGQAFGSGLFLQGAGTLNSQVAGGQTQTISNVIADEAGVVAGGYTPPAGFGTPGSWALTKFGAGTLVLTGNNIYSGGTTITAGTLQIGVGGTTGSITGAVTNNGVLAFNRSNAYQFDGAISGTGAVTKDGSGTTTLGGTNTYSGATVVNTGTLIGLGSSSLGNLSAVTVASGASLGFNASTMTFGSLAGGGTVGGVGFAPRSLTMGGDTTTTTFSGVLQDFLPSLGTLGVTVLSLTKEGAGTTTLSGTNTYTGATSVNGGTLNVTGSIAASSLTSVNAGGTLAGTGTVGNTAINSGGTLLAGSAGAPGTLTISGSLAFQSGAFYLVQLNPVTASLANVTGTATLNGATVNAVFANGSYVSKQYTILTANGGLSGAFSGPINTNLPTNFHTTLSYDANHAYLNLMLSFAIPGGLNGNQQAVGNALTNFFNTNGTIPLVYSALTPAQLSQTSGETATGTQQTTFDAMTQFMGLMTDPFIGGRGDNIAGGSNVTPFAEEIDAANAYAAKDPPRSQKERDAYAAIYRKAPAMAAPFVPGWSVWAAGYGGSQITNGNAVIGSNSTTSRIGAAAVGADYRFSPNTIAGFAMAGGGTNFSVYGFGTGRSDLFQAGAFVRHIVGPAYFTAAMAYGWQDLTTDRTVTISGIDQLRARFNANAFSGRIEDGYRFATPAVGITPYAAAQFTTFELPAYAESVVSGANTFALAYGAKSVTATRSEIGLRTDKSWAMADSIFTLRGRFAWAHDYNTDRSIGATFQTLPGASFVVNGAAQSADKALTTASAEVKWHSGVSLAATFEGEFSGNSTSYAGKGVARYQW
jgi:autotransporter-associated beta strand protein